MRTITKSTFCLAFALAAGCISVTEPRIGDEFTLRPGESARFASPAISVTFTGVTQDSRCPTRVQCVWAGDGAVELRIADGAEVRLDTLHTHPDYARAVDLATVTLELVRLDPYPDAPDSIESDSYQVTLVVRNRQ